jgi:hypothetical protein
VFYVVISWGDDDKVKKFPSTLIAATRSKKAGNGLTRVTRLGESYCAYCAIVYFGQYSENYRSSPYFVATFSTAQVMDKF